MRARRAISARRLLLGIVCSMTYRIAAGVSFCALDGAVVVLDEKQDRYFFLRSAAARALRSLADGLDISDDDARRLLDLRIIAEGAERHAQIEPAMPCPPRASAIELPRSAAQASARLTFDVAVALASAYALLRFRRLEGVLRRLRRAESAPAEPTDETIAFAQLFDRTRSHMPLKRACLLDSVALIRFLDNRGHHADLVIGVKLNPFMAHCWAQAGDLILNESVDRAASFAPIRIA